MSVLQLGARIAPGAVVFSAIQPTGVFHLGNYLGAVKSWVDLAHQAPDSAQLTFAVADLHAVTIPKNPDQLRQWRHEAVASILAAGIDPNRCTVYFQSQVPAHSELSWLLSTVTGMGYLNRMVQWKSKLGVDQESASIENMSGPDSRVSALHSGLFTYPVLQAADILLHGADLVPVGDDQAQHLELTRHIASTFNHQYPGAQLKLPQTLFAPFKKILSLRDPAKKMSKSDPDQNGCVYITDAPEVIRSKIKRAVTDSIQGPITYDLEARTGVSNLLLVAAGLLNKSVPEILASDLSHVRNHGDLKAAVTDICIEQLAPIRAAFERLKLAPEHLQQVAQAGRERATTSAKETLDRVHQSMGYD